MHVTIVEQKIVSGRVVVEICNVGRIGAAVVACIYMIYLSGNERDHGISGSPRGSYYRMLSPIPFSPCRSKSHPLPFLLLSRSNPPRCLLLAHTHTHSLSHPLAVFIERETAAAVYSVSVAYSPGEGFGLYRYNKHIFPVAPGPAAHTIKVVRI